MTPLGKWSLIMAAFGLPPVAWGVYAESDNQESKAIELEQSS